MIYEIYYSILFDLFQVGENTAQLENPLHQAAKRGTVVKH